MGEAHVVEIATVKYDDDNADDNDDDDDLLPGLGLYL